MPEACFASSSTGDEGMFSRRNIATCGALTVLLFATAPAASAQESKIDLF
jgi:hypothetical protein